MPVILYAGENERRVWKKELYFQITYLNLEAIEA